MTNYSEREKKDIKVFYHLKGYQADGATARSFLIFKE